MNELKFGSLGETWINLVRLTIEAGAPLDGEGYERLGVQVCFPASPAEDPIVERFGDASMVASMKQVFFTDTPNALGHSYAKLMRGPGGRGDLRDVVDLLRGNPWTKRATVTFCGEPNGKVPCINVVQFLVREGQVRTIYFSRGQDAYRKFYADALCLAAMGRRVAEGLDLAAGTVEGFIASSHVYYKDLPAAEQFLAESQGSLARRSPVGVA